MRAEFYCKYDDDNNREFGFTIIPESRAEADLLEMTRRRENRKVFDYNIEFKPGDFVEKVTFENVLGVSELNKQSSFED